MKKEQYIKYLIEKELSYLGDNMYRYELDNKNGRWDTVIKEHQEKIDLLKV